MKSKMKNWCYSDLPAGHLPKLVPIMGYPVIDYRRAIRRSFQSVRYY